MEIMNHREMEYETKKLFERYHISIEDGNHWFHADDDKAIAVMQWLKSSLEQVTIRDIELDYGLDCMRGYLMFEKKPKPNDIEMDTWDEGSLEGVYKFLCKYHRTMTTIYQANLEGVYADMDLQDLEDSLVKAEYRCLCFLHAPNTLPNRHNVMATLMDELKLIQKSFGVNELVVKKHEDEIAHAVAHAPQSTKTMQHPNEAVIEICKKYMTLVSPFAPYITEQLWKLFAPDSLAVMQTWSYPQMKQETYELPVQINGKCKAVLTVDCDMSEKEIISLAKNRVQPYLKQDTQYSSIFVPGKIINFVSKA